MIAAENENNEVLFQHSSFMAVGFTEIVLAAILRFCYLEIAKRRQTVYTRAAKSITLASLLVCGTT